MVINHVKESGNCSKLSGFMGSTKENSRLAKRIALCIMHLDIIDPAICGLVKWICNIKRS